MASTSMSKPKYASKEALDAIVGKYERDEERRADMVRLVEDGSSAEVELDVNLITIEPDDFNPKRNTLAFHFESDGEMKFFKFAMKWGAVLRRLLADNGGRCRVLITRHGVNMEDTSYDFVKTG